MTAKYYKWCAVPLCKNTSISAPNKVFVYVPNKKLIRDKWLKLARRNPKDVVTNSSIYFCEDHFDLPNDMENYMQHHIMGSVSQVRMKPGCLPKKFACQSDFVEKPFKKALKKRKMMALEECEKEFRESAQLLTLTKNASGSSDNQTVVDDGRVLCQQRADKSVQVFRTHKFRSKAVQTNVESMHWSTSSEKSVPGSDDDDLVDEEFDERIINITTRVDTLEQQSKEYNKIFKEFGETVTSRLQSLPIVSALRLHKRIEIVIEKFFSSLLDPAETNDSSHLKEFVKKKKVNTSKKGSSNKRKPSKRAPKPSSSDLTIEVIPESATTSDSKSKAQDVPFTPNRLGKPQVEYNKPVSTPLVKKPAGKRSTKSLGNKTGKTASPSSSTESDPESKPPDLTFTHDRLIKSEDDCDLPSSTPLLEEDNGSSISFCIDPGSQSITVVRSTPKRKTHPSHEDPTSESESEKQARLDDVEVELDIKLEEDECIVKTEQCSDNDDINDPLQLAG